MAQLALLGVGAWGSNYLRNLIELEDAELSVCCDIDPARLEVARSRFPSLRTTDRPDDVLADPAIDGVVLATPTETHAPLARAALEAGKHVLVEKPLAFETAEAEALIELADRAGRKLMVGHLLLFHPAVAHLRDIVQAGTLGEVLYAHTQRLNLGRFRKAENVLFSLATHDVSLVLDLFRSEPVRVIAYGGSYLTEGVEDVVFLAIWFRDGKMANVHVSWLDPHKVRQVTLVGDKKMVVFDDMSPTEKIRILDRGFSRQPGFDAYREFVSVRHGDIMVPHIRMKEPLLEQCRHFVSCIRDDEPPYTGGEAALRVVRVLAAAEKSLRSRVPVAIHPGAE